MVSLSGPVCCKGHRRQQRRIKQPRGKRQCPSYLEYLATDQSLPLLPLCHFVEHSWETSARDMHLAVADFASRGWPAPKTREEVLKVPWFEKNFR